MVIMGALPFDCYSQSRQANKDETALYLKVMKTVKMVFENQKPMDERFGFKYYKVPNEKEKENERDLELLMKTSPEIPFDIELNHKYGLNFYQVTYSLEEKYFRAYDSEKEREIEKLAAYLTEGAMETRSAEKGRILRRNDSLILTNQVNLSFKVNISINERIFSPYHNIKDKLNHLFPLNVAHAAHAWHIFSAPTAIPFQNSAFYFGNNYPSKPPNPFKTQQYTHTYPFKNKAGSVKIENIVIRIEAAKQVCDWFAKNIDWKTLESLIDD